MVNHLRVYVDFDQVVIKQNSAKIASVELIKRRPWLILGYFLMRILYIFLKKEIILRIGAMFCFNAREEEFEKLAYMLKLNDNFLGTIRAIRQIKGKNKVNKIEVVIVSRSSKRVIEIFTQRPEVNFVLQSNSIEVVSVVANEFEVRGGRVTGKLIGRVISDDKKFGIIPEGSIYLGDDYEQKILRKYGKGKKFNFINVNKIMA